ncbi:MAG: hypothetical protein WCU88_03300 [Elusimicrobiota bacterium]
MNPRVLAIFAATILSAGAFCACKAQQDTTKASVQGSAVSQAASRPEITENHPVLDLIWKRFYDPSDGFGFNWDSLTVKGMTEIAASPTAQSSEARELLWRYFNERHEELRGEIRADYLAGGILWLIDKDAKVFDVVASRLVNVGPDEHLDALFFMAWLINDKRFVPALWERFRVLDNVWEKIDCAAAIYRIDRDPKALKFIRLVAADKTTKYVGDPLPDMKAEDYLQDLKDDGLIDGKQ